MATRTQNAERVVREAFVSVRRARREGHANKLTRMALWVAADNLNIGDFSIRTAERLAREEAALMGETDLLEI